MDVEGRFLDHADESGHTFRHDGIVGDACHAGQVPVEAELGKVGGKEETRRFLENLGFVVGGNVTVVSEIDGNLIVNVKDSRVAVGKDMAAKILI